MIRLAPGTVENLGLKMTDILPSPDGLTTMNGTTPLFDVVRADEAETPVLTGESASVAVSDEMVVLCLIDTTADDGGTPPVPLFPEGKYNLYLQFTNAPEIPRLGPFPFMVDD